MPVTTSIVKESGMGKAIGSIEKHRICADSPNKGAIVERANAIKDAWRKSVKLRKDSAQTSTVASDRSSSAKRGFETSNAPIAKKMKVEDTKKSSFSSLLKKVDPAASSNNSGRTSTSANGDPLKKAGVAKKVGKRLKWKDHFGGKLEAAKVISDDTHQLVDDVNEASGSWSDRKNRDRLREKELIAKAKCVYLDTQSMNSIVQQFGERYDLTLFVTFLLVFQEKETHG